MRVILDLDDVKVARSVKTPYVRITGLRNHIKTEDIFTTIEETTGGRIRHLRSNGIPLGPDGMRVTVVTSPSGIGGPEILAAKGLQVHPLPPKGARGGGMRRRGTIPWCRGQGIKVAGHYFLRHITTR